MKKKVMNEHHYITFLSWEDRFLGSYTNDLKNYTFSSITIFRFDQDSCHHLEKQHEALSKISAKRETSFEIIELAFGNHKKNWEEIQFFFAKRYNDNILLNISTMPRNIVYYMLHFLHTRHFQYEIIYYPPLEHDCELTKNPLKPILIFRHSGIFDVDKKTLLIVGLGYDEKRVFQLCNYFEPQETIILKEADNVSKIDKNIDFSFEPYIIIHSIKNINSFVKNNVFTALKEIYDDKNERFNILLCSIGPKVSSLEFFKFQIFCPHAGLIYIPSQDYNASYSKGINFEKKIVYDSSDIAESLPPFISK